MTVTPTRSTQTTSTSSSSNPNLLPRRGVGQLPNGVKISTSENSALVSWGVSDLDALVPLRVGTVNLIISDQTHAYSSVVSRCFISQAYQNGHYVWLDEGDGNHGDGNHGDGNHGDGNHNVYHVYGLRDGSVSTNALVSVPQPRMKIAWRYEGMKSVNSGDDMTESGAGPAATSKSSFVRGGSTSLLSSPLAKLNIASKLGDASSIGVTVGDDDKSPIPKEHSSNSVVSSSEFCCSFDTTKSIRWSSNQLHIYCDRDESQELASFEAKYRDIQSTIDAIKRASLRGPEVLRIVLHIDLPVTQKSRLALFRFLHSLRGLLRYSFSVATIVLKGVVGGEATSAVIDSLLPFVDAAISLKSFGAGDTSYFAKEYHGILQVLKRGIISSSVGSTKSRHSSSTTFGFRARKHRFAISTMHLPPELGDESRTQGSSLGKSATITTTTAAAAAGPSCGVLRPSVGKPAVVLANNQEW